MEIKSMFVMAEKLDELEAENAILRECVELIAGEQQFYCEVGDANKQAYARQVLKKLEPKNEKTQSEKLIDDLNAYAKQALKELDAKKGLKEQI